MLSRILNDLSWSEMILRLLHLLSLNPIVVLLGHRGRIMTGHMGEHAESVFRIDLLAECFTAILNLRWLIGKLLFLPMHLIVALMTLYGSVQRTRAH